MDTAQTSDAEVCEFFQVACCLCLCAALPVFAFINGYGGELGGQLVDATPVPIQASSPLVMSSIIAVLHYLAQTTCNHVVVTKLVPGVVLPMRDAGAAGAGCI